MVKVLITEDDISLQAMYQFKLEAEKFEVQVASNGIEGLEKAEAFKPDLILLDLMMPQLSGDQMLQRLRQTDWGANMRVIILTNVSRSEAPSVLRFLNVDRYVVKAHHTPAQIVSIVEEVLAG
jgi:two-component system, OmpR family, response regulator AdeR